MPSQQRVFRCLTAVVVAWLACLWSLPAYSADEDATANDNVTDENTVDVIHRTISEGLSDFIGQIDLFFSDEEQSARVNKSWARVRVDTLKRDSMDPDFNARVKLKLILPRTEQRFRLLLSSEDEQSGEQESSQFSPPDNDSVSFALRFLRTLREDNGLRFDVGARVRDDILQTFVAVGGFYRKPIGKYWTGTVYGDLEHFSDSGFENLLSIRFDRYTDFAERNLFLHQTRFNWKEGTPGMVITQTAGVYRELDQKSSIAVELLTTHFSASQPGRNHFDNGEFRIRYRKNIWRDWFYVELWPSVLWPQEKDYSAIYGGTIRVEALIGRLPGGG